MTETRDGRFIPSLPFTTPAFSSIMNNNDNGEEIQLNIPTASTKNENLTIDYFIQNEPNLSVDIENIRKDYYKEKRFCFFRFAQNFGGKQCSGLVICGYCEFHWMVVANITFLIERAVQIDDQSKVKQNAVLKPVFLRCVSSPLAILPCATLIADGNDPNAERIDKIVASSFEFCRTFYPSEHKALCLAYAYMILPAVCSPLPGENEITRQASRRSWINDQIILLNSLQSSYISINSEITKSSLEFSIFDSPMLCLPKSTWIESYEEFNTTRANISIFENKFVITKPILLSYPGRIKLDRESKGIFNNFNIEMVYETATLGGMSNSWGELVISNIHISKDMVLSPPSSLNQSVIPINM